jgi:centromeric protein E
VSPSALNLSESLSTLSFAQGLKRVVLRAERKEVVDPQALIQQYQNEIAELRALLREKELEGEETMTSKSSKDKNQAMEKRLNELKSLILTSVNVQSSTGTQGQVSGQALSLRCLVGWRRSMWTDISRRDPSVQLSSRTRNWTLTSRPPK